jgi:hypothetical protein
MTSTNRDVAQDIGLINRDIGFNIACVFYFATADGKESDAYHEYPEARRLKG